MTGANPKLPLPCALCAAIGGIVHHSQMTPQGYRALNWAERFLQKIDAMTTYFLIQKRDYLLKDLSIKIDPPPCSKACFNTVRAPS